MIIRFAATSPLREAGFLPYLLSRSAVGETREKEQAMI
jgi:hypothetical protein